MPNTTPDPKGLLRLLSAAIDDAVDPGPVDAQQTHAVCELHQQTIAVLRQVNKRSAITLVILVAILAKNFLVPGLTLSHILSLASAALGIG